LGRAWTWLFQKPATMVAGAIDRFHALRNLHFSFFAYFDDFAVLD
jgi:hypothetical protein